MVGQLSREDIAIIIAKARKAIFKKANSTPLSHRQRESLEEGNAEGPWCVSRISLPAPPQEEHDAADVVKEAIEKLDQRNGTCKIPPAQDVGAEWLAYCEDDGPARDSTDHAKYDWISSHSHPQPTIFYIQGGAFVSVPPPYLLTQAVY